MYSIGGGRWLGSCELPAPTLRRGGEAGAAHVVMSMHVIKNKDSSSWAVTKGWGRQRKTCRHERVYILLTLKLPSPPRVASYLPSSGSGFIVLEDLCQCSHLSAPGLAGNGARYEAFAPAEMRPLRNALLPEALCKPVSVRVGI
jgi:hypothetical protein